MYVNMCVSLCVSAWKNSVNSARCILSPGLRQKQKPKQKIKNKLI